MIKWILILLWDITLLFPKKKPEKTKVGFV